MKYDAVIVGAGPAGGSCARELAKKGRSVLILEKSLEMGEPNFSTAGTPPETIKDFQLPKDVIFTSWNSLYLGGPSKNAEFVYDKIIGYTLKFRELKQFLVKDAIKNGADSRTNANVSKAVVKDGKVVGVEYSGIYGKEIVYADVIIDATGANGTLASQLGLRNKMMERYAPTVEYYMDNLDLARNGKRVDIYVGSKYQGGYAWIFPTGKDEAKIGLGWAIEDNNLKDKNLLHNLDKFVKENKQLKNGKVIELHSHFMFANGGLKKHSLNGFLAIGDAANQVNPLVGEGIRHCLHSGKIAANIIDKTLKDKGKLNDYDKEWGKYVGNKWKLSVMIQKYLCKLNDSSFDALISKARYLNKDDILEVLFHYNFKLGLKYIRYAPSLVNKNILGAVLRL